MSIKLNGLSPGLGLLLSLWTERPQRTAKMQRAGAKYITVKTEGHDVAITDRMLGEHLEGKATYAAPLIGADGLARALVIELDTGSEEAAARVLDTAAATGLTAWSIICPGSDGHDGSHTWILYDQEWNPERLQEQSRQLLRSTGLPEKEVYPSHANIRLPYGLHVRTRRRGVLMLQDGERFELDTHDDLVRALTAVCALPRNTLPPPPAPERAAALYSAEKARVAGDITPLDDFDGRATRNDVEQLLTEANWNEVGQHGSVGYWARPGKAKRDGHGATLGHIADTVLTVFTEGDATLPGKSGAGIHYGPAKLYTHLVHGGDFSAAAKDLYTRGYGSRKTELPKPILKSAPSATPVATPPSLSRTFILACLGQGEAGDAQLVAAVYRGQLCYDHAAGAWYVFGAHQWVRYDGAPRQAIWSRIAATYLELAAEETRSLATEADETAKKRIQTGIDALAERAKKLRSLSRINNVLILAQELLGIRGDEWDADPWLLGVKNGVVDLRTGHLRDGLPGDYIRTAAPTIWEGLEAPAPRWERFISEIMSDEADRVAFLQRLLGYGLNGSTKEHILGVFVGARGRNGKRVLFETLQHVLGAYAKTVSTDVLIGQNHKRTAGSAQPHLMELQGKRIAYCSETGEYDALSTAQVKNITGGDPITARWLNENPVTFLPTHTLFLQTNRKPQAPADDDALWERVKVVEFKVRFVEHPTAPDERPRDLAIEETLQSEASGILAWLVRGGLDWLRGGLQTPASVRLARDTYRKEESIEPFLDAACVEAEGLQAEGGALYAAYDSWCKANKLRSKSPVWFGKQLQRRFEKGRTGTGRTCYYGLGLETSEFEEPVTDNPSEKQALSQSPSDGISMPNTEGNKSSFTRFSEGLEPLSDSNEGRISHEGQKLDNPSDPSDPSEMKCETEAKTLADVPWASVRMYWEQGDIQRIIDCCRRLWLVDPDEVLAKASRLWPDLVQAQ